METNARKGERIAGKQGDSYAITKEKNQGQVKCATALPSSVTDADQSSRSHEEAMNKEDRCCFCKVDKHNWLTTLLQWLLANAPLEDA